MSRVVVITGMGRSGTKWTAKLLNESPGWKAEHEPFGGWEPAARVHADLEAWKAKQEIDGYVRVDSYLRHQVAALVLSIWVDKVAVIVRDPIQICQSIFNRRGDPCVDHVNEALLSVDGAIQSSAVAIIRFDRWIGDRDYRRKKGHEMGILVDPEVYPLAKNASKSLRAGFERHLPEIRSKLGWFIRQYGGGVLFG